MRNENNVLLLSMSTLPREIKAERYLFEDEVIYGFSQLEPITKLLVQLLKEKGEQLHKVVIMATEASLRVEKKLGVSACEFYKNRICCFVGDADKQEQGDLEYYEKRLAEIKDSPDGKLSASYLSDVQEYLVQQFQSVVNSGIEIITVPINEENEIAFYFEVINAIQKGDVGESVKLYLDMQGGDRNAIAQMNAIVSLLEERGVEIAGRYGIEYNPSNTEHPINEVSKRYFTYGLISAMQAFKKYGRGQSLIEYFGSSDNERDKKLVKAIKKTSDAIRLCDIDRFDDAIKNIATLKAEYEGQTQTELDIVFQDIVKDYGKLLDKTDGSYIAKIKWCLRKGFIQQALTIVESKMPPYLMDKNIIKCNLNQNAIPLKDNKAGSENYTIQDLTERVLEKNKKQYIPVKHHLAEQFIFNNSKEYEFHFENLDKFDLNELVTKCQISRYRDPLLVLEKEKRYFARCSVAADPTYRKWMPLFMHLHIFLKNQRNTVNHGKTGEARCSIEVLEKAIEAYVKIGELMRID